MQNLTPDPSLQGRILSQIQYEKELQMLKKRQFFYYLISLTSLPVFVLAVKNFTFQAHQSGFLEILKLIRTDFLSITTHFNIYFLSLLESMPAVSVAITGIILLTLLLSAIKLLTITYDIRRIHKIKKV